MAERHPIMAWASLVALSLAAAGLWRAEVEWHGWGGLTWIGYFHWAVPISAGVFIAWIAVFCGVHPWWKRAALIVAEILFAVVALWAAKRMMVEYFYTGANFEQMPHFWFDNSGPVASWGVWVPGYLLFILYPLVPVLGCAIARAFGVCRTWKHWLVSNAVFLAAYPVAYAAVGLTRFAYDPSIHTIKTGFIVPLLIVGLGAAFLPMSRRRRMSPEGTPAHSRG